MKERTGGLIVFLVAVTMYGLTLHPSVAGGDSGELMVCSHELAVPHPPGYPTFTFTTKAAEVLLRFLSKGAISVPLAQNMFHGFLSTMAVVMVYYSTHRAGASVGAAIASSLLFGFCPNVWTYAVSTEVFPLNNFLMAFVVFMSVTFEQRLRQHEDEDSPRSKEALRRFVHLAAFACGLSLTNQHTSVLFVVPIVLWVFGQYPRTLTHLPTFLKSTTCFFLGMSPYLYLAISSTWVYSANSWGRQNNWTGFWRHFFREEYGTFSLASKEASYKSANFERCWKYFVQDISDQTLHFFWIFAAIAAIAVVWKNVTYIWGSTKSAVKDQRESRLKAMKEKLDAAQKAAIVAAEAPAAAAGESTADGTATDGSTMASTPDASSTTAPVKKKVRRRDAPKRLRKNPLTSPLSMLLFTWTLYTNFFNYLSNLPIDQPLFYGVQQRFWLQPLVISSVFVGLGLTWVVDYFVSKTEADEEEEELGESSAFSKVNLEVVLGLVIGFAQISANFASQNESDNYYIRDFGRAILGPLPNNSIVLTKGDIRINSARFMQTAEHFRPDLRIVDQEMMTFQWYIDNVRRAYGTKDVVFPGNYYYPNRPGCFDMKTFIDKNRRGGKRRMFLAYGFKEGDTSCEGYYTTRQFGLTLEVISHEDGEEMNSKLKVKIPDSVIGWPKKGKEIDRYARELFWAMPDIPPHRIAPIGRYPPHSWEAVITSDFQQALQLHSHQLLLMADADQAQPDVQLPHPYKYYIKNVTETLLDETVPMRYRSLLAARKYAINALSFFDLTRTPAFIRRNLGVILQNINRFHSNKFDYELITELRDTFHIHMQEARAQNTLTPQDAKQIQSALDHYHNALRAHVVDDEDDDEDSEE